MNRVLVVIAAIVVVAVVVFVALAWRPGVAPIEPPDAASFPNDQVARGHALAEAGYCASCHTKPGGPDYAGGRGIESDFGTIYATNITSDPDSGIGRWSEEAFARAMRKGIRRDGAHLFPAFPYTHFAKMTDDDVAALYAYFQTVPAATTEVPETKLSGIFGWRALQGGWKLLYFHGGGYRADTAKSDAYNRGAYLAEGVAHCAACHSPRNSLGAEEGGSEAYSGAVVEGWYAPAINASPDAPLPWTHDELFAFLRGGGSRLHGVAAGTMAEVVQGLAALPDSDIDAIATYYADLGGAPASLSADEIAAAATPASDVALTDAQRRGELIFVGYCVSCHDNPPANPSVERPQLTLNSDVTGPDPTNFVHVVINGVSQTDGLSDTYMPGFGLILSDRDIADVADYLRAVYASDKPKWTDLDRAEVEALRMMH